MWLINSFIGRLGMAEMVKEVQSEVLGSPWKIKAGIQSESEVSKGVSSVVQWLQMCLAMQRTRVQSLVQEDPTFCAAAKPVSHNRWAHVS